MVTVRTVICLKCFSAAQQCEIDTDNFPEGIDLLAESATGDNKCSAGVFNLPSIGNISEMECDLQCKAGYYNASEPVKVVCEPNPVQTSPDGITRFDKCERTWLIF